MLPVTQPSQFAARTSNMNRSLQIALVACVLLTLFGALCSFSGDGPQQVQQGHRVIAHIAELLTLPIPTRGIADIRDCMLPLGCGTMLILVGLGGLLNYKQSNQPQISKHKKQSNPSSQQRVRNSTRSTATDHLAFIRPDCLGCIQRMDQ